MQIRKHALLISLLLAVLLVGCSAPPEATERPAQQPPNIVLLFADDLGYGDLSSYGHPTIRTPNLDRLAREGIRLTSFYAQTSCARSRAALLTGRYPERTGFPASDGGVGSTTGLPSREITIAEVLAEDGYRTKMIGKWHLGYAREELLPISQGFDSYYGLPYSNDMIPPWIPTDVPLRMYRNARRIPKPVDQDTLTQTYTDEAVAFIRAAAGEPFFLYQAYNMPHLPVHTTERFRGTSRAGLYGDVMQTLDWSAGRIMKVLEEQGLAENTIVIFASDNGPWTHPGDRMLRGGNEPWHTGSPGPLRGWKGHALEGGIRVPGIIRWPAQIPAGQTSAEIATTMDLFTTLAEAAGAQVPQDRPIDGNNLLPFLRGETSSSPTESFFYFNFRGMTIDRRPQAEPVAVRAGPWKLWTAEPPVAGEGAREKLSVPALYNLDLDPGERYNVAEDHPELVERLQERMRNFTEQGFQGAQ